KQLGRRSRACNLKQNPAVLFCANAWRYTRSLSPETSFFRRACANVSRDFRRMMDSLVTLPAQPASEFSMASKRKLKITALAGGVGASKLLLGLYEVMD